jgi:polyisoprenoid-binding protein YceI
MAALRRVAEPSRGPVEHSARSRMLSPSNAALPAAEQREEIVMTTQRTQLMPALLIRRAALLACAALVTLTLAAASAIAMAGAEALVPTGGAITVTGTSTLHDWSVRATGLKGSLALPVGFLAGEPSAAPVATFTLPARALTSEHDRMNKLMWESLAADKHPNLIFALESARLHGAGGPSVKVEVKGSLTVAGVPRPVTLLMEVRHDGDRVVASGELPLKMSDFGIKPPTAMMGTVRTGDAVRVKIETTLTPGS